MSASKYTPELGAYICEEMEKGRSLREICADATGMPTESVVRYWTTKMPEFAAQYTRARELGYDRMAESIVEISDETEVKAMHDGEEVTLALDTVAVQRNRLRVDARKWLLSKMLPKKYGDKIQQEHTGANGGPIETIERRIVDPNVSPPDPDR